MAGDVFCCPPCLSGAPRKYRVKLRDVKPCSAYPCDECGSLNADYILEGDGYCGWSYVLPYTPCNWPGKRWALLFWRNDDCTLRIALQLEYGPIWENASVLHCWETQYQLTLTPYTGQCFPGGYPDLSCEFPTTITVEPIGLQSLQDTDCLPSCPACLQAAHAPQPDLGPPSCRLDQKCGCEVCRQGAAEAALARLTAAAASCGCGGQCAPAVSPVNGNLSVRLPIPGAGALAPADQLTFNSRWGAATPFGYGVSSQFAARVEAQGDCDALLQRCDGSRYRYGCKNPTDGTYRAIPPGAPSALRRTADGWEETGANPNIDSRGCTRTAAS